MVQISRPSIQIDLKEFKLHLHLKSRPQVTLHFDSPSRRFYLSVIALVVNEMKRLGKIKSISLQEHLELLILLNESIGGSAGSSEKENLLHRIYRKWKDALPNLEEAPLFKVLGKKKEEGEGAIGKIYLFTDEEKDEWANLFEYMGSEENVRLKFAIDKIGVGLNETSIIFGDFLNTDAWDRFISSLKNGTKEESEPMEETSVPETPAVPFSSSKERKISWLSRYRWFILIVVVIGIVAGAIWKIYLSPAPTKVASVDRMKYPLPELPSIAVLPFVNLSGDPKQEFFCDGTTEEIINALSKVPRLFVIARNSTSIYKGKSVNVKQISEELGVQYVLEGGIQRSGNRVRITAQLIDALTGHHIWSERYGRDMKDIFALQDEITTNILTAMQVKITEGVQALRRDRGIRNLDCYLKLLEGVDYSFRGNIESNRLARQILEEVLVMCPESSLPYVYLASTHMMEYFYGSSKAPQESLNKAIELAQKAISLDDANARAQGILSLLYTTKREHEKAVAAGERAVALDPNGADAHAWYGTSLYLGGRPGEEAIRMLQRAIRLNPFGPAWYFWNLGNALRDMGRYEEAVLAFKKALQRAPHSLMAHLNLATTYSMMGRGKEAQVEAEEVLRLNPKLTLEYLVKTSPYKDQALIDRNAEALRKAGLK
jgi:TolB-like protein/Tfp pilus assembly protein PilF